MSNIYVFTPITSSPQAIARLEQKTGLVAITHRGEVTLEKPLADNDSLAKALFNVLGKLEKG